jgi:hypothetical protein
MTTKKNSGTTKKRTRSAAREDLADAAQTVARKPRGGTGVVMAGPYKATPTGFVFEKFSREAVVQIPLCNFTAAVVEERTHDDGLETETVFVIEGRHATGRPLPPAEVPAAQFAGLSWIARHWGAAAIYYAGQSVRDHVRVAILSSGEPERKVVYKHIGWRKFAGTWRYLHNGGAIGADGNDTSVTVALDGELSRYELPDPPKGKALVEAVRASLALREVTPDGVLGWLLLAAAYRAPTGEAHRIDHSVFTVGQSGRGKTAVTAIALAHFGPFDDRSLPANWQDTPSALEVKGHAAKDAILIIDDFKPVGSGVDVQRLHAKADIVLRAQGNRSGRARLRPDLTARAAYTPRGMIVGSGEDYPQGESLGARIVTCELMPGDVDFAALTDLQAAARDAKLRAAMSAYLAWLAPRMDGLCRDLPARARDARDAWREEIGEGHARAPDNAASLWLGVELLLEFATDVDALTAETATVMREEARLALLDVMRRQADISHGQGEADRFVALLRGLLHGGRCHLKDYETQREPHAMAHQYGWRHSKNANGDDVWHPLGDTVGWVKYPHLWLEPENIFAQAQAFGAQQRKELTVSKETVWRRLAEAGYIVTAPEMRGGREVRRTTCKRTINGRRERVLVMPISVLFDQTAPDHADHMDHSCEDDPL